MDQKAGRVKQHEMCGAKIVMKECVIYNRRNKKKNRNMIIR